MWLGLGWGFLYIQKRKHLLISFCCVVQDLVNFDDPLNVEAAEHYSRDKVSIQVVSQCRRVCSRSTIIPSLITIMCI